MPLSSFGLLEQIDLIEAEKRDLLMRFMDAVVAIYAPNGATNEARELIKQLRNVYFVGHEEADKLRVEKAARELEALSRKVWTISAPTRKGGAARITVREG